MGRQVSLLHCVPNVVQNGSGPRGELQSPSATANQPHQLQEPLLSHPTAGAVAAAVSAAAEQEHSAGVLALAALSGCQ